MNGVSAVPGRERREGGGGGGAEHTSTDRAPIWLADAIEAVAAVPAALQDRLAVGSATRILRAALPSLRQLAPFRWVGFVLVDRNGLDFAVEVAVPGGERRRIERELEHLAQAGTYAWALFQNRPVYTAPAVPHERGPGAETLLLHSIATRASVRGMFVGCLPESHRYLPVLTEKLMSLVFQQCSWALELLEGRKRLEEGGAPKAPPDGGRGAGMADDTNAFHPRRNTGVDSDGDEVTTEIFLALTERWPAQREEIALSMAQNDGPEVAGGVAPLRSALAALGFEAEEELAERIEEASIAGRMDESRTLFTELSDAMAQRLGREEPDSEDRGGDHGEG